MKIGVQVQLWEWRKPELGGGDINKALKDISSLGLDGIEVFDPSKESCDNPGEFRSLLSKFNVALSGIYHAGIFITPETQEQELKEATQVIKFLRAVNGEFLVLSSHQRRKEGGFPESAFDQLAETVNKIGKVSREHNIRVAYHPHVRTLVETREELKLLMDRLDPDLVGLCPHAVHFMFSRSDPYEIHETYADRVTYMHVSDVTGADKINEAYCPTNIGQGEIDHRALMKPLLKAGFDGWVIIEGVDPKSNTLDGIQVSANFLKKIGIGI